MVILDRQFEKIGPSTLLGPRPPPLPERPPPPPPPNPVLPPPGAKLGVKPPPPPPKGETPPPPPGVKPPPPGKPPPEAAAAEAAAPAAEALPPPNGDVPVPKRLVEPLVVVGRPWMALTACSTSSGSMFTLSDLDQRLLSDAAVSSFSTSFWMSSYSGLGQATHDLLVLSSTPTDSVTPRGLPLASRFWRWCGAAEAAAEGREAAAAEADACVVVHAFAVDVADHLGDLGGVGVLERADVVGVDDGVGVVLAGVERAGDQVADLDHVQDLGLHQQRVGGRIGDDADVVLALRRRRPLAAEACCRGRPGRRRRGSREALLLAAAAALLRAVVDLVQDLGDFHGVGVLELMTSKSPDDACWCS